MWTDVSTQVSFKLEGSFNQFCSLLWLSQGRLGSGRDLRRFEEFIVFQN